MCVCGLCVCVCVYPYSAESTGIVLLDVGLEGAVTGISPGPEATLPLVWLGVTGFFPQVVKLKREPVPRVKKTPVAQISMFCDQNLSEGETGWTGCCRDTLTYDTVNLLNLGNIHLPGECGLN